MALKPSCNAVTWRHWVWTSKLRDAGLDGRAQVAKDKAAGDLTIIDWLASERAKFRKTL